ncbi:MAG: hypothetical protein JNM10_10145 [Planctomycetia bacterium]|nr:hypothetical protein [Planctomycetia bacterium]
MALPRSALALLLTAVAGVGGYLAGSRVGGAPSADSDLAAENDRLRDRVASLERDLAGRPVALAASGGGRPDGAPAPAAEPTASGPRVPDGSPPRPGEEVPFPKLADGMTQDEFVKAAFRFLEVQLARGPEGHFAILKAIDEHLVKDKGLRRLFSSEEDAVRFLYPLLKFAVHHEGQVVDLMATTFRAMAETPQALDGLDDNTLEMFTEGIAMVLPGAVGTDQLAKFSGWVEKVLATPRGSLPRSIEGNRSDLERLLQMWAPPLTVDQAIAVLAKPDELPPERLASIVRRLPQAALAKMDLLPVLGSLIDRGDFTAVRLLQQVELAAGDLAVLDRREIAALGDDSGIHVSTYLSATRRTAFESARGFFDAWGASPDVSGDKYASAVLQAGAPAAYLRDVLARQKLSEQWVKLLTHRIERLESPAAGPR